MNRRITKPIAPQFMSNYELPTKRPTLGESFSPVKAGKNKSHVIIILDESSSMYTSRKATIDSCNEFLDLQRADAKKQGIKTYVSIYKFNGSEVYCITGYVNIKKIQHITAQDYVPNGMTNLNDAVGSVMATVNQTLKLNKKKDRESVIFNIITDGYENCSKSFTAADIKLMISKAEEANWSFNFMGADIDAFAVGRTYGLNVNNTIQFNKGNIVGAMRSVSRKTSDMRLAYAAGADTQAVYNATAFTNEERDKAVGEENG